MKKLMTLSLLVALSACAVMPSNHGFALLGENSESVMATTSTGTKTGEACGTNYLSLFTNGDSSVEAAKKNGRITTVSSVDRRINRYMFVAETCTIVTGK